MDLGNWSEDMTLYQYLPHRVKVKTQIGYLSANRPQKERMCFVKKPFLKIYFFRPLYCHILLCSGLVVLTTQSEKQASAPTICSNSFKRGWFRGIISQGMIQILPT